ncbi:MAG: radical SAM protein [Candidatus Saccharicenans sp.]|nr:radical SAM protein [Candidatus Saccharicenans sp.]
MRKELHRLVFSVTSHCNLHCKYCYVLNNQTKHFIPKTMTPEIIQKAIRKLFNSYSVIKFIQFFGGEPNLALPSMRIAVNEIRKICTTQKLPYPQFGIVTNLTILNEEILSFYKDNSLKVTVSLDGPENIHNFLRACPSGSGTQDKVVQNLKQLHDKGIPFDVECTFTKLHIEKGITVVNLLEYFDRIGAARADIVGVMAKPDSELYVYGETLPQLIELFVEAVDYWFDYWRRGGKTVFGIVAECLAMISSSPKGNYCTAGESNLAVAPDGKIYPCHLFIDDNDCVIGSVEDTLPLHLSGFKNFFKNNTSCHNCPINTICFSCLGRNKFYSGNLSQPFAGDCLLKYKLISRILEHLGEGILPENWTTSSNG